MGGLDNGRHGERTRAEGVTLKDSVMEQESVDETNVNIR